MTGKPTAAELKAIDEARRAYRFFLQLDYKVQREIIRYVITADSLLPAQHTVTLMPGLVGQHVALTKQFRHSYKLTKLADMVFWAQNTVSVTSLEQVQTMINGAYAPLIKRLYIAHEADMGAGYSKKTVTGLVGTLKVGLNRLRSLEYLAVAIVYPDVKKRMQKIVRGGEAPELDIVVEALTRLTGIKERIVLLKNEGDDAAVGDIVQSTGADAEEMVNELLALGADEALLL